MKKNSTLKSHNIPRICVSLHCLSRFIHNIYHIGHNIQREIIIKILLQLCFYSKFFQQTIQFVNVNHFYSRPTFCFNINKKGSANQHRVKFSIVTGDNYQSRITHEELSRTTTATVETCTRARQARLEELAVCSRSFFKQAQVKLLPPIFIFLLRGPGQKRKNFFDDQIKKLWNEFYTDRICFLCSCLGINRIPIEKLSHFISCSSQNPVILYREGIPVWAVYHYSQWEALIYYRRIHVYLLATQNNLINMYTVI